MHRACSPSVRRGSELAEVKYDVDGTAIGMIEIAIVESCRVAEGYRLRA